jgi:ubiquinol-cytochrome c reductase cytochrome c1 subunit
MDMRSMLKVLPAAAVAVALGLVSFAVAQDANQGAETPKEPQQGESPHYPILHPQLLDWTFAGPFGRFDPQQLQRGFNVYKNVCSGCHSLNLVAMRTLGDENGPHFSDDEVTALAASYSFADPTRADGKRPGAGSDYFPAPFADEAEARSANGGALPPDLSMIAKARAVTRGFPTFLFDIFTQYQEGGPDYIHALLTGYQDPPQGVEVPDGQYYNPYFISGPALAMPTAGTLSDGAVSYPQNQDEDPANDVPETVDQYARDVAAFLMWTAEPHMVNRKSMGLTVIIFLIILGCLTYYTKKKVWAKVPGEGAA